MRIAIIGLGGIAQRAYLPIVTSLNEVELILCSRAGARLAQLANQYRVREFTTQFNEVLSMGIDAAFVHVATEAHEHFVSALLEHGVHVYVDKPLAYTLATANRMVALAEARRRVLMVGFNRRYAPMYRALADQPECRIVILQKNRRAQIDGARRFVFDDFIHVVDTLRYLAPGPIDTVTVNGAVNAGQLRHVLLQLNGDGFSLVGLMNRDSGANEETLELMSSGNKWLVQGLTKTTHFHDGAERVTHFDDWDSVLWRRGFPQIIEHFIHCVRTRTEVFPTAQDALATHALCEQIVQTLETMGAAPMAGLV